MSRRKQPSSANGEVEELLRAAEDSILLDIRSNSAAASSRSDLSPSPLDADLARRFQALKSRPPPQPQAERQPHGAVTENDLAARFARLTAASGVDAGGRSRGASSGEVAGRQADDEEAVEELMRWAADAARLDPSSSLSDGNKSADEEGEGCSNDHADDEDSEEDDDEEEKRRQGRPKKWIFF